MSDINSNTSEDFEPIMTTNQLGNFNFLNNLEDASSVSEPIINTQRPQPIPSSSSQSPQIPQIPQAPMMQRKIIQATPNQMQQIQRQNLQGPKGQQMQRPTQTQQPQQQRPIQTQQPQQRPQSQQQVQSQVQSQMQSQMQPQPHVQVGPNLTNSYTMAQSQQCPFQFEEKSVTFNEIVEEKIITPIDNSSFTNLTQPSDTIKKVKIGKLMVPKATVMFTGTIILLSIFLFFATKPKSKKSKKHEHKED
jgi:hypothetical protein